MLTAALPPTATPGERLFAAYLRQRRLPATYEKPLTPGGRAPDFQVDFPLGAVACEVYEPALRLPRRAGAFDSVGPIQRGFKERKRKQAQAAARAGLPFVLVLARTNSEISFDPVVVGSAMFGRLQFTVPVWTGPGEAPEGFDEREGEVGFFGGGGKVRGANTSVSAVAVLTSFNPTWWRFERRADHEFPLDDTCSLEETVRLAMRRDQLAQQMHRAGEIDFDAQLARLTVLHNPRAKHPVGADAFGGPHDRQWAVLGKREYGLVAEGRYCTEIPG